MSDAPLPDDIMVRGLRRLLRDVELNAETTAMGLEETIVGETAMTCSGHQTLYRGYLVSELVEDCDYTEVAYLLIKGELPDEDLLADFRSVMDEHATVDPMLLDWIESVPLHVPPMDVLRSAVSMLSHFDPNLEPFSEQGTPELVCATAIRLLAQLPTVVALRVARERGWEVPRLDQDLSYVASLFLAVTGRQPTVAQERALNKLMILHACNGFDGPTLAARTATSCRSDFYSAVLAGVSAVKGGEELGGVRQHLLALQELAVTKDLINDVRALLTQGPLDGFIPDGHDLRGLLLDLDCRELATEPAHRRLEVTARAVEQMIFGVSGRIPDLRWSSARVLHYLGFDDESFGPLLAISRIPGWAGHCREQLRSPERVRPIAQYVGPEARELTPLSKRR